MSKINRIPQLRIPGVLCAFEWLKDLPDFGRYNVIYGWNGSGKTTLSRLLRDLELHRPLKKGEAIVCINDNEVKGEDFPLTRFQVRVFNRDFVNENIFPVDGGDVPPIFVVGKESVEKQKEISNLKNDFNKISRDLETVQDEERRITRNLEQFSQDQARKIKETLRGPGNNPFNNYDKSNFQQRALQMIEDDNALSYQLSDEERSNLRSKIVSNPKPKISEIVFQLPDLKELVEAVENLLSANVISAAIESLKNDARLAKWTREGLELHKNRQVEKCLFCEQPLRADRISNLEAHFSTELEHLFFKIEEQIKTLDAESKQASAIELPKQIELYEDLGLEYSKAENALRKALATVKLYLSGLVDDLNKKKSQPFDKISVDLAVPSLDLDSVEHINEIIRKHNHSCDEFETQISRAHERLSLDMISASLEEFKQHWDNKQLALANISRTDEATKGITQEIRRLEEEIVAHRKPAEELNHDLRKYLGHNELQLEIKDTGYTIIRNKEIAQRLSEGEMTAIAVLYFLKSLEDRSFDLSHGVVVIDDPVSSLDANALFLAFSFICERTKEAGQLFILTHNYNFFRLVRNWFHNLIKSQKRKNKNSELVRFYMMECAIKDGVRCSELLPLDTLLERYESDYHYLFSRIFKKANESIRSDLEQNYALPNMARRVLEAFLAFRQPQISGQLWKKMKNVEFDESKKTRILRFVHTYSHNDFIGEPGHDPTLLGETQVVLKDLLDLINSQDPKHLDAMVQLIDPLAEGENTDD